MIKNQTKIEFSDFNCPPFDPPYKAVYANGRHVGKIERTKHYIGGCFSGATYTVRLGGLPPYTCPNLSQAKRWARAHVVVL